jgi:hypothetical protein
VKRYFQAVEGFSNPEAIARKSEFPAILQFMGMGGGDPFYAIIAHRLPK